MEGFADRDERYARYLLGDLPEEERARLEEEYFADDAEFERLAAVRDELTDLYARGELPARERRLFEEHFLATAPRRRRAREAEELIEFSTRLAAAPRAREGGAERRPFLLRALARGTPALRFSFAALLLLAALGGAWLLVRRADDLRTERAAATPSPDVARQGATDDATPRRPEGTGEGGATPSLTPAAPPGARGPEVAAGPAPQRPPAAAHPPSPRVATLLLSAVLTRGEGPANTLLLRPDTDTARLRLPFKGDGYRRYVAVLRTVEGEEVWRGAALSEAPRGRARTAAVNVPARTFRRKDHTVTLYGVTPAGELQEIDEYFFTVEKGDRP